MRPWRSRDVASAGLAALAAIAAFGAVAARAAAAEAESPPPRSVRVDYEAAAGCPDQRSFEGQIRARSSKIALAQDGAATVRVRIAAHAGRFEGDVVLSDPKGHEARRRVDGGCSDVVAALALITALALDPAASTASDPTAPGGATTGAQAPSATAAPPPPQPPAASPEPTNKAPEAALPSDSEPIREEEARAGALAQAHPWGWSIGAEAGLTGGVAPSALVSVPAFLDVWRRSAGPFAPAFRLRFERADSGTVSVGSGGADFLWTAGSLDVCPVAWSRWRLRLWPCARAEGGALSATGAGVAPTRTDTRPWVMLGLVARARVTILGSLFVELEGGAFMPLVRDRFFLEPDSTVQRAPVVLAAGAAGVGVTFW